VRSFVGAFAAALTFLTVSTGSVAAQPADPPVTASVGIAFANLITTGGPTSSGTELQVPVNYTCTAGQLTQVNVIITQPRGLATVGSTLASAPVLPVCTGSPQTYVIGMKVVTGSMTAGSSTYNAVLYAASTQPWPSTPGGQLAAVGPTGLTIESWDNAPPNTPTAVTNTQLQVTPTSVTLSWGPPATTGGSDISAYDVACATCLPGATGLLVPGSTVTFRNLHPGQQYLMQVSAINGAGVGPAVSVAAVTSTPVMPHEPGPVTGLQLAAVTPTLIALLWNPPSNTGGQAITGYVVGRNGSDTNGFGLYSDTLPAIARNFTFFYLFSNTTYRLTITPITAVGQGAPTTISVKTAPSKVPSMRQVVTLSPSARTLGYGQRLVLSVAVRPPHHPQVALQLLTGRSWGPITSLPLRGKYSVTFSPIPKTRTYTYRAVALASPGYLQGISPSVTIHVVKTAPPQPLNCTASVNNAHPKKGSTIHVRVTTTARARVTAHLGTGVTHAAMANSKGVASIAYRLSHTVPARSVPVAVKVTLGPRAGACRTSFTPKS
jgi:hypothetical protein